MLCSTTYVLWQQTDLPPSRGANSAVANGNRRPLRPLTFQRSLSRYCTMPVDTLQNIYFDYANVLIGIWGILSSKIQVYGIFCPLKYKYMGYSALWNTSIWDILFSELQVHGTFPPLEYKYMGYSVLWNTSIWDILSSEMPLYGIFCSLIDKYLSC